MNTNERLHRLLRVFFVLVLLCTGLVGVHRWLPPIVHETLALCCRFHSFDTFVPLPFDTLLLYLFTAWILGAGTWILTRRVWRTHQHVTQLLRSGQVELPPDLVALLAESDLYTRVVLVRAPQPVAFCFGFVHPRVCLSTGLVELLSQEELKAVLLHETHHLQRRDPLRLLLAETASILLFFLPIVREWRRLFEITLELDADRYAVRKLGKPALAGALYRLLGEPHDVFPAGVVTAGLRVNAVRIAELLGDRSTPERVSAESVLHSTLIVWLVCLLLMI